MAKSKATETTENDIEPAPERALVTIKILADAAWSSQGRHDKGEIVEVTVDDAKVLCDKELAHVYVAPPA